MTGRFVSIDAETYYDPKARYSLTSMTAEEYIRDPRFQEILWTATEYDANFNITRSDWISGGKRKQLKSWLHSWRLTEPHTATITHNGAGFDYLILGWVHGIHPWLPVDTLQIARARWGRRGPDGNGNSLKALSRAFATGEKGDEIVHTMGRRLEDFSEADLRRFAEYGKQDNLLTAALFRCIVHEVQLFELVDMAMHTRMSSDPMIEVDTALCAAAIEQRRANRDDYMARLAKIAGVDAKYLHSALMSNQKFATLLQDVFGVRPPTKISPATGKKTLAFAKTDPQMRAWLGGQDEAAYDEDFAEIIAARAGVRSTIMESRLATFQQIGGRGRLPAALRYAGAHTGRAAADGGVHKGQLHNTPGRPSASNPDGKRNPVRLSMRAPPGMRLYAADSSQIEVRVLAWLADEGGLLPTFARGMKAADRWFAAIQRADAAAAAAARKEMEDADPYLGLGKPLFGRAITRADKHERNINKAAVLAAGYKQGATGFRAHCARNGIQISEEMAAETIAAYRASHLGIVAFWRSCKQAISALAGERGPMTFGRDGCLRAEPGRIILPSGRSVYYADCAGEHSAGGGYREYWYTDRSSGARSYIYDGKLTENIVQACAYDVLQNQARAIYEEHSLNYCLFVHDELCYAGSEGQEDYYFKLLWRYMRQAPEWMPRLPLGIEFSHGETYGDI